MTKPKYKPILFAAPMVMAILEGRKTQTRRLNNLNDVNGNPDAWDTNRITVGNLDYMVKKYAKGKYGATFISLPNAIEKGRIHVCPQICPYTIGQRVWVREKFKTAHDEDNLGDCIEYADGTKIKPVVPDNNTGFRFSWDCDNDNVRWRPAIHMPRWASRINLEITGVRVERLQDISAVDCWVEGIRHSPDVNPIHEYMELWQSLHGPDSWDKNPWVWVAEFKRVEG